MESSATRRSAFVTPDRFVGAAALGIMLGIVDALTHVGVADCVTAPLQTLRSFIGIIAVYAIAMVPVTPLVPRRWFARVVVSAFASAQLLALHFGANAEMHYHRLLMTFVYVLSCGSILIVSQSRRARRRVAVGFTSAAGLFVMVAF